VCSGRSKGYAIVQTYNLSIAPSELQAQPDLLQIIAASGITDLWLPGFLYGYWLNSLDTLKTWRMRIERAGMGVGIINLPFGHPGDSLGAKDGDVALSPPPTWKMGVRADGSTFSGTSLHLPATDENCAAIRLLASAGFDRIFLDDDFRLASPGVIGGCYCSEHVDAFCVRNGYPHGRREELLADVRERKLTPLVHQWCNYHCDLLTESFRLQQQSAPDAMLGNMVMYLGAEKAGIRLSDFQRSAFRVGEGMFNDESFGSVKAKTDELFSVLFHRRYAQPDLAFSETTAFPADRLSSANLAAKVAIPLIADVRNIMFMSGLSAFPAGHWAALRSSIAKHRAIQPLIAGHRPVGPLKHFWGEASRLVGDDKPFSLFLACGIPFEVSDAPARSGWTFLGDYDACEITERNTASPGTVFVSRLGLIPGDAGFAMDESLGALFAWKKTILPSLQDVPYVIEDSPVVCAWYPSAQCALLWNLLETSQRFTVTYKGRTVSAMLNALDFELIELPGFAGL